MLPYIALIFSTWASSFLNRKNIFRYLLFFVPTVLIVGFRYEVGFDWPVYSDQFYQFQPVPIRDFFPQIPVLSIFYSHEPLFLIISYFMSQIFPEFEYFQFFAYLVFLFSVFQLGKALGSRNIIAAMLPIHLFLLFTLEFSTLRQSIAISFYNLGLAYILTNRGGRGIWLQIAAIATQSSTAIYFLVQLWTTSVKKWSKLAIIICLLLAVFLSAGGLQLLPVDMLPGFLGQKLNYYFFERGYNYNLSEQMFFLSLFFVIAYILHQSKPALNGQTRFLANLVVFLCIFALMTFWINTIRNRIMYEVIIISSLIAYGPAFRLQRILQLALLSAGVLFFTISLTKKTSFVYIPYQNFIWYKLNGLDSDGLDRQHDLRQLIINSR